MTFTPRFFEKRDYGFFLFGPRGTGKSTWLKKTFSEAAWVDLLDGETFRHYFAKPERLKELVESNLNNRVIVLDEIQRVPQLLPVVHQLIEEHPSHQFIMTGSSARKLKREGTDLLAGRAILERMHPFMAAELGSAFSLDMALSLGMLPLVNRATNPEKTLRSYINLYIDEEVKMEGLVRQAENFVLFLEAISFSHGNLLNINEVSRECQVKRNTVQTYVQILEDLFLARRLHVFTKRAKRATVSHPKFFLFDCGVYRSLRPSGPLDRPEELMGPALEGLVYQHLQAWIDYSQNEAKLYFWRTLAGSEVDFIVYGNSVFWAIEVKNTAVIRSKDIKPLRTFLSDYPMCKGLFLYRGKEMLKKGGVLCLPVEKFLEHLHPGKALWQEALPTVSHKAS